MTLGEELSQEQRRVSNIPLFIRDRSTCKSRDLSRGSQTRNTDFKEQKKVSLTEPTQIAKMKQRIELSVKGTPKVVLTNVHNGVLTYKV